MGTACFLKGWGQPAFYNTEAIIQELLNAGKTIEDARRGGTSGCVETGAFGNEAYILTGYFNLPKILELTLYNGYDIVSKKQIGLPLGYAKDFKSYEELFDAYKKQIEYLVDIKIEGSNVIEKIYAEYMPAPFLSVITKRRFTQNICLHHSFQLLQTTVFQKEKTTMQVEQDTIQTTYRVLVSVQLQTLLLQSNTMYLMRRNSQWKN